MKSNLTMLDYIKKITGGASLNKNAEELLSHLNYPEEDKCNCMCCSKPETHKFYRIPNRGVWLIGSRDHTKIISQHPDWIPEEKLGPYLMTK